MQRAPKAFAKDVGRTLQAFARTARARQIYQENSIALKRMMDDLVKSFEELLGTEDVLTLRIRPDAFVFDDELVYHDDNPDDSLSFAFYRDGVRRLEFYRGLERSELDILITATARGFAFSGLGDDIVSHLWRHDLEHIRYLVVDTTIVDAPASPDGSTDGGENSQTNDIDVQIDGLLRAVYGTSAHDDVGPKALHLDAADLAAKAIAESLDSLDENAPGFHPTRTLLEPPKYATQFLQDSERETPNRVSARAVNATLKAMAADLLAPDKEALAESLLRMLDAAVVNGEIPLATRLIAGMLSVPQGGRRVERWLDEALSETRLRQLAQNVFEANAESNALFPHFHQLLRISGQRVVPIVLGLLPSFVDATLRRALSDLALELGIKDGEILSELLHNEQLYVAQESLYIISKLKMPWAEALRREAENDPRPEIRIATLSALLETFPNEVQDASVRMLSDPDPKIKIAGIHTLGQLDTKQATSTVEELVESPKLEMLSIDVKREVFRVYAKLSGQRALHVLARYVKKGEGLLTKREAEEIAVAAMDGVMMIRTPRAVEILKRAAVSRSKRVREAARRRLELLKRKR